jgi:hypothetical protein
VSDDLNVDTTSSGTVTVVRLAGAIDDDFDAKVLQDAALTPVAVLDLCGVGEVTDAGVEKWRQAIGELGSAVEELILVECSPAVVERMSEDPGFVGAAAVASAQIVMTCTACGRAATPAIDVDIPVTEETLEFACAECNSEMALAAHGADPFEFCHLVPTTSLSQDVQVVVNMARRPKGPPTLEPGSEEEREFAALSEAIAAAEAQDAARVEVDLEAGPKEKAKPDRPPERRDDRPESTGEQTATAAPASERCSQPKRTRKSKAGEQPSSRETEERIVVEPVADGQAEHEPTEVAMPALTRDPEPRSDESQDDGTNPSIRVASVQQFDAEATSPSKRPAVANVPTVATASSDRLLIVAAAVIVALIVVVALLLFRGPGGVPPEALLAFHEHLTAGQLEAAEALVEEHGDSIPDELRAIADNAIGDLRDREVAATLVGAKKALARKKYADAVANARAALEVHATNADGLFVAGESLRLLGRLLEAAGYYATLIDEHPDDPRVDDAMFWRGEALLTQGKQLEARPLFERVIAIEKSNFARSAARRIEQIDTEVPEHADEQDDSETQPNEDEPEASE